MADGDKITIDQINFGSDIPEWATEATQNKILKALESSKKVDEKDLKEQQTQTKSIKTLTQRFEESMKAQSQNSKNLVKSLREKSGNYTKSLVDKNLKTPFKSVNLMMGRFAMRLGFIGAAVGGFAMAIGAVIGRLKQFSDAYRQMFSMGFRFEQGAMGLAKAAVAAEMGIDQYTEILGKYATSVGILGTRNFSELNKSIRDNLQSQGLLGMSLSELTEYTGSYIEQLKDAGILSNENNEYLEEMASNYLKNITAFTQLANVSRDQIDAVIKSATSIDAFTNRMNTLPATVQRTLIAATQTVAGMFAGLGTEFGDQLATTFTQAYGRGGLFFTEAGRSLLAVNKRLYNSLDGIINNLESMSDQEAAQATANLIDEIANTSDAERERLGIIERSNTEYAAAAGQQIALINKIQQLEEDGKIEIYKDLQKLRQESKIDQLSVAFINFERATQKFKMVFNTFFTRLFGNDKLLKAIEKTMTMLSENAQKLADWVLGFADKIGTWLGNWMGDLTQATSVGDFIAKALGPIFSALGDAITRAIVAGWEMISMDIPFLGTSRNERFKEDFLNPYQKLESVAKKENVYGGQEITDLQARRERLQSKLEREQNKAVMPEGGAAWYESNAKYRDDSKIAEYTSELTKLDTTLKGLVTTLDENNKKNQDAMAKLMEGNRAEFEKYFSEYDYEASLAKGKLIEKEKIEELKTSEPEPANEVANADPSVLNDARMRIMKQYLPMSGSSDPNSSPETAFYETTISLQQQQLDAMKKQLAALENL